MKGKTVSGLWKRLLTVTVALGLVQALLVPAVTGRALAADGGGAFATNTQVEIQETITDGFTHPGVGLTKATLETMREAVSAKKEPWYSYYQAMTVSASAAKTVTSSNQSSTDPFTPASDAFNSQGFNSRFIADGLKAYTQALMFYITGDETYRANAMHIIRIWSQMDPAKYVYFTDSHIHTGIPLNRMVAAAEILRYSSCQTPELAWTESDTDNFTNHLVTPVIETFQHNNNRFMNQHNYPLLGAMAGYIFTNNTERYKEAVEWFTVNKTAVNQGFNGSVKQLFRLVDTNAVTGEKLDEPYVQHVEMGRDQAHGGGDLTNAAIISRMLLAQGTKVDPVQGTVSTEANAVGPYEFLNDRILAAANYFWQYMLGYDTPWTPVPYSYDTNGKVNGIYRALSDSYRGRMTTANFWDLYYYYAYEKGINLEEKAPYFYEAFTKRIPSNYYHQGVFKQNWDNVDGGGDFWLYLPGQAEAEGSTNLPKEQTSASIVEIEDRYTVFDNSTTTRQEGGTSYVEVKATAVGSKFVIQNLSYADRSNSRIIGLKFRTNGGATVQLSKEINSAPYHTLTLPDTKGEWRYITYDMGLSHVSYGQIDNDYNLLYMKVIGAGTTVDIDHFNILAGVQLTPPVFKTGMDDMNIVTVADTAVSLDFSATDSSLTDTIVYSSSDLPQGAELNPGTGVFTWQQPSQGTYSYVIAASDGTTITAKKVTLLVSGTRESAVQAIKAAYNSDISYTTASLEDFINVSEETQQIIQTANDSQFFKQLLKLKAAVDSLQMLTPQLPDTSMDYSGIVSSSTFGTSISMLVDGNNNTFPVYSLAPYPDLFHILDFGPNYKVSASAFSLQSRMNFVDRMAGSAVFGSNDKVNWTRLTPDETPFTDEMARLEVDDVYKNEQYRFIKIQMIHPQPDVLSNTVGNLLELGELRIFGQRHETNNKLEAVTISSDQAVQKRVTAMDTVKLAFKSIESIQDVRVVIQGQTANIQTEDNLHWLATVTMGEQATTGNIKFSITYKAADGTDADPSYFTTDGSLLYLVDRKNFINVNKLATVVASDPQFGTNGLPKEKVGYLLFDGDTSTFGDIQTGSGSFYTVDFGADSSVILNEIMLMPRVNFPGRLNGLVVQGSNDNVKWTDLTRKASGTVDGTWSFIGKEQFLDSKAYRYVRLYNASSWFGNVAEVEFYGEYMTQDLESKMASPTGYTKGSYYLYQKEVKRIIKAMNESGADKMSLLQSFFEAGKLLVSANTLTADQIAITPVMVTASTLVWGNGGTKEANGWHAFDGNLSTYTDTTANPSWISIDLGEENANSLGIFKFHPRKGNEAEIKRVNGAILQGSNDGVNYTDLYTISGISAAQWYTVPIVDQNSYRYLRYYAPSGNSNVAELELYKKPIDRTLLNILLGEAGDLSADKYEQESYAAVEEAVFKADLVQKNVDSTQAQIDTAAGVLLEALGNLVVKRTIVKLEPLSIMTSIGVAPKLPNVVKAVYSDLTNLDVNVTWEEVSPSLYAEPGKFTVSGAVYGIELKASAFVVVLDTDTPAADEESPTPPVNLNAASITSHSLILSWGSSMDNIGVSRYDIYRDEAQVGTVTADTYSYTFTKLTADTNYKLRVNAYDVAGNHASSESYTVKTAQADQLEGGNTGEGSTPTAPMVTGNEIQVKAVMKDGVATAILNLEIINQAIAGASQNKDKNIVIDLSGINPVVASIVIELPADGWLKAQQEGIKVVAIKSSLVTLTFPTDAIQDLEVGDRVKLAVHSVDPSTLPGTLPQQLSGMPVLDFKLWVNDQLYSTFKPGSFVKVSIPYTLRSGEQAKSLVAAYLNDKGELEIVKNAKYDSATGEMGITVKHFSKYAVIPKLISFNDMNDYAWANDSVVALAAREIVNGVSGDRFAPGLAVTRSEFLKLLMEAYELIQAGYVSSFTDVKTGQWYSDAVASAQALNLVAGYPDGSFGLNQAITREEMAVMALRILKATGIEPPKTRDRVDFQDDSHITDYAKEAVKTMSEAGWIDGQGGGNYAPFAHATRAEAAVLIERIMGLNE